MSVEIDPELDPEERLNKFYALTSAALGVLGLCTALLPACGVIGGVAGVIFGILGLRSERKWMARVGIALSVIGILTAFIYSFILYNNQYGK